MITLASSSRTASRNFLSINYWVGAFVLSFLVVGVLWLNSQVSSQMAALWVVGAMLGLVLYHSAFGFTHAWRAFIADRRGDGLRAQMLMLAVGVVLFFPFLAAGTLGGQRVVGFVMPPGIATLLGAFLFGLGMQIGGGCASGTLFNAGGGSTRMVLTLLFFIVGSVLGAINFDWWSQLPALPAVSFVKVWGLWPALLANLAVFAFIAGLTVYLEQRRHGKIISEASRLPRPASLLRGPWPLAWGAIALVLLNFATLALAGRPWGITGAFTVWGSKVLYELDVYDPTQWSFWMRDLMPLIEPVYEDITSVMNVGLIAGAMGAAALAGKFALEWRLPWRSALASIVGGLLLGYGSRIAFGCNISAYFSGILSASLHAWVWLPAAIVGNILGVYLRPWFGLSVEKHRPAPSC